MKIINNISTYVKYYDELRLNKKIKRFGKALGSKILFYVLVLGVLISDNKIPLKVRLVFIAALGYLIVPLDLISDFLPMVGFTDDIAFISYAINNARMYITPEITSKAKDKLSQWIENEAEEADIVDDFVYNNYKDE